MLVRSTHCRKFNSSARHVGAAPNCVTNSSHGIGEAGNNFLSCFRRCANPNRTNLSSKASSNAGISARSRGSRTTTPESTWGRGRKRSGGRSFTKRTFHRACIRKLNLPYALIPGLATRRVQTSFCNVNTARDTGDGLRMNVRTISVPLE